MLDQSVAPNTHFKTSAVNKIELETLPYLTNALLTYPQYSEELFEGYEPVFTAPDGTGKVLSQRVTFKVMQVNLKM